MAGATGSQAPWTFSPLHFLHHCLHLKGKSRDQTVAVTPDQMQESGTPGEGAGETCGSSKGDTAVPMTRSGVPGEDVTVPGQPSDATLALPRKELGRKGEPEMVPGIA